MNEEEINKIIERAVYLALRAAGVDFEMVSVSIHWEPSYKATDDPLGKFFVTATERFR